MVLNSLMHALKIRETDTMTDEDKKREPEFSQEQYDMIMRCSEKENMSEWNEWREQNRTINVNLQKADLSGANLQKAILENAYLQKAKLIGAKLQNAYLTGAKLQKAVLTLANLQGVILANAYLQGSKLKLVRVDGMTIITGCKFDKETDFTGTGLDAPTIDPALKAAFKNNIRRIKWQQWCKDGKNHREKLIRKAVRYFWQLSDYGSSTGRIIEWFFGLAFGFGAIYWLMALIPGWDGIIKDLWQGSGWIGGIQTLVRSLYFSIVTMTTLGFGDMHAASNGFWESVFGNIFLSVQVLLGYVLLGALVTRLGILFTSEAPAATPSQVDSRDK